uniref:Uncharacterized protein n=1 Tax=Timema poppense TaxID=170557 RepID=A0A7R9DBC9_TIMPO|nr:unnamed protein product [Timema poppensis]
MMRRLFRDILFEDQRTKKQLTVSNSSIWCKGSEPPLAWRESGKPSRKTTLSSPKRDSNLDHTVFGKLAQHVTSALANYATEAVILGRNVSLKQSTLRAIIIAGSAQLPARLCVRMREEWEKKGKEKT